MSTATLYTGLDLHKRSLTAATLDADGTLIDEQKLPCHPDALRLYFAEHAAGAGGHRAVVECTTGWYWVKDVLATTRGRRAPRPRQGRQSHCGGEGQDRQR